MIAEPPARTDIELWDFQRKGIDAVKSDFAAGYDSVLLSLPTGSGKTVCAVILTRELRRQTVFLVHRDELVKQTVRKFNQISPELSVGVVAAKKNDTGCDVTVASVQTLASPQRLMALSVSLKQDPFVICDEAHHWVSPVWSKVVDDLKPWKICGLTATAYRADGIALSEKFEKVSYHHSLLDLIARGILAYPVGLKIQSNVNLDKISTYDDDFSQKSLGETVDTPERNALIAQAYMDHVGDRKSCAVFCVSVEHALHVSQALQAKGIWSEIVHGKTPGSEREWLFDTFSAGKLPVLANCMIMTEGNDIPCIDMIIMARPTKSASLYTQIIGRGLRTAPGKRDCLIMDVVDVTSKHTLVTMPTLAGIESKTGMVRAGEKSRKAGEVAGFFDLVDEEVIADRKALEVNLLGSSKFLWKKVGDYWMTRNGQYGYLVLCEAGEAGWVPLEVDNQPDSAPSVRGLFDRPLDIGFCMGVAESKAILEFRNEKTARWRSRKLPPTEKQLKTAKSWGIVNANDFARDTLSDAIDEKIFLNIVGKMRLKQRVERTKWQT